jgi:hypothetical protein
VWKPFCRRLSEQGEADGVALAAALAVIEQLAHCCGDFISRELGST